MRPRRRTILALLGALALALAIVLSSGSVLATTFSNTNTSTSSGTVVVNAVKLSRGAYPRGAPAAVVANGESYGQAAGASVLARAYGGPMLVAGTSGADSGTLSELKRLRPAVVYVVGLPASVASQIDTALAALSPRPQVVNLRGEDAQETAAIVARQVEAGLGTVERVVIVPSDNANGVMAASAMAAGNGWPLLLTPEEGPFPQVSTDAIVAMGVSSGIAVGTSVAPDIDGFSIERAFLPVVTDDDPNGRHGLCTEVAEWAVGEGFCSYDRIAVVRGGDLVTSEVLASHVAADDGVLVLTRWKGLPDISKAFLKAHGEQVHRIDTSGVFWPAYRELKSLNSARVSSVSPGSGPVSGGGTVVVTGTRLDTATSVVMGKITLPRSSWRIDSSTQLTVLATPEAYGGGPVEIIVNNYWNRSPANPNDVYRFADGMNLPGDKVVNEAIKYLGTPYVWSEETPSAGFDCSGLCQYVFGRVGVGLPRVSYYQATTGTRVSTDAMLPGDLVHFGSPVYHVGIYVGGGLMINAPRSGDLVTIENVFRSSLSGARRYFWPYTKHEQEDSLLAYAGPWQYSSSSAASGGSYRRANEIASLTISFSGMYLGWLGPKAPGYGIARVTLDDQEPVDVDLFRATTKHQTTVWHTGVMDPGPHTVKIEWTGEKNAESSGTRVGIDAFELLGSFTRVSSAPAGSQLVEQSDPRICFLGDWNTNSASQASGGSIVSTNTPGRATVSFNGSYINVLAKTAPYYGKARAFLDGEDKGLIDFYNPTVRYMQQVYETGIIAEGAHTLVIEWTGEKHEDSSSYLVDVDAVEVLGELTESPGPTRYEQDDTNIGYAGAVKTVARLKCSGESHNKLSGPGAARVTFNGTYLAWIARRGLNGGIAKVTVDGDEASSKMVDLYNPTTALQSNVYSTGMLEAGEHTVTIEWTGRKNSAATQYVVSIDAFDVLGTLTPAPELPPYPTRYEQTDSHIGLVGNWTTSSTGEASGASFAFTGSAGSMATVNFHGTGLTWIAKKSPGYGMARVRLDDRAAEEIDLYDADALHQERVYETGTLSEGDHVLTIEWTGERSGDATGYYIGVDAFDVFGDLTAGPTPDRYEETDPALSYSGRWRTKEKAKFSGGSIASINSTGSVTAEFEGTYLAWIANTGRRFGKARVTLDAGTEDERTAMVNLYTNTSLRRKRVVWSTGALGPGTHTVTVEWTGKKSWRSLGTTVTVDAFDVIGTLSAVTSAPVETTEVDGDTKIVMIDPGHQKVANYELEPIGPGSSTMKAKVSAGTASVNTGSPESALNLALSLKLRAALQEHGIEVLMTREVQNVNISNAERAQMANAAGADLFVRMHADGASDPSVNGVLMLRPASIPGWTDDIVDESKEAAKLALEQLVLATGAHNRGMSVRSDISGFNWSDVPVFLAEVGLMTNPTEDALLATEEYQDKIVAGLTNAIVSYLGIQ